MLNEELIEALSERLVNRVEKANTYTLQILGERIRQIGTILPSDVQRINQLLEYGGDLEKIADALSTMTERNILDIYKILDEVAKENYYFSKTLYEYRDMNFIPYEQNIALQQQVRAIADITVNNYSNLSRTLGFSKKNQFGNVIYNNIATTYQNTIDESILSLIQGKENYQTLMKKTINDLGISGIKTVDWESGYSKRLDSAVRMNIMDGIRSVSNKVQEEIGREVGTDAIEVSVHDNPALDHAEIQGHIFLNDEFDKMQSNQPFQDINDKQYNAIERAISVWNCYHYIFSVISGISKPQYTNEQLENIIDKNKEGFEFNGVRYSNYGGEQLQRRLETEIRSTKELQTISKASGNEELVYKSQRRINHLTAKYNELSKVSGLPTKIDRLRVSGYKKIKI